jgi:hypothetical protein
VIIAFVSGSEGGNKFLNTITLEGKLTESMGNHAYDFMGVAFFALMGWILYKIALKK